MAVKTSKSFLVSGPLLETLRKLRHRSVASVVTFPDEAGTVQTWKAIRRVLVPGGYVLAGAAPALYYRMATFIEDAGFAIKDCIVDFGAANSSGQFLVAVAQRPQKGTYAKNALRYGVAGLNVDGCRVGSEDVFIKGGGAKYDENGVKTFHPSGEVNQWKCGRWPANITFTHSSECVYKGEVRVDVKGKVSSAGGGFQAKYVGGKVKKGLEQDKLNRFVGKDGKEPVEIWECVETCVVAALDRQSGSSTSPATYVRNVDGSNSGVYGKGVGQTKGTESLNYGDSGGASRFFQTFASSGDGLNLARLLCRLSAPPDRGVVLDPFATGRTARAALLEGRSFIGLVRSEREVKKLQRVVRKAERQSSRENR